MKSLKELEEIRNRAMSRVNMRHDRDTGTRIVVGMATCGIAAGARPVLNAFVEEVQKRGLSDVVVSQTGCIGVCRLEPMAEAVSYTHLRLFSGESRRRQPSCGGR